jgi:3-hydroxy-9,10-secoandrosta-1,3,5(10)-triene-9,17-dione monooxygenase
MDLCQRFVDDGIPFGYGDDMLIGSIAREAYLQAWETMQGVIWRTAGSSAAAQGERMERIFRDLAMMNGHRNTVLRDWAFRAIARDRFGLPRE